MTRAERSRLEREALNHLADYALARAGHDAEIIATGNPDGGDGFIDQESAALEAAHRAICSARGIPRHDADGAC